MIATIAVAHAASLRSALHEYPMAITWPPGSSAVSTLAIEKLMRWVTDLIRVAAGASGRVVTHSRKAGLWCGRRAVAGPERQRMRHRPIGPCKGTQLMTPGRPSLAAHRIQRIVKIASKIADCDEGGAPMNPTATARAAERKAAAAKKAAEKKVTAAEKRATAAEKRAAAARKKASAARKKAAA